MSRVECPECDPCSPAMDEEGRPYTCYRCCDTGWITAEQAAERASYYDGEAGDEDGCPSYRRVAPGVMAGCYPDDDLPF